MPTGSCTCWNEDCEWVPLQKCVPWKKIFCIDSEKGPVWCLCHSSMGLSLGLNMMHMWAKKEERNPVIRSHRISCKENECKENSVWTMGLQAVLLCPKSQASCLYDKTKLQVHKFTLFDLHSKEGHCYTWDESEGDLSSDVFAHLQYRRFETVIKEYP